MDVLTLVTLSSILVVLGIYDRPALGWHKIVAKLTGTRRYVTNSVSVIAPIVFELRSHFRMYTRGSLNGTTEATVEHIKVLARCHKVAEVIYDLIKKDGAGSWPPNANHARSTWPIPLLPYKEIYLELAEFLPQAVPSLDDQVNIVRINKFRRRFRSLLAERVDLVAVKQVGVHKQFKASINKLNKSSFWKQLMQAVGTHSPEMYTTHSIAALPRPDMHIGGQLYL